MFLPLVTPPKTKEQIITRDEDGFTRRSIGLNPSDWVLRDFQPIDNNRSILATRRQTEGEFEFRDTCGIRYVWQGELKSEYAQRIAHVFATELSRVAVAESEWLRRMAKSS